MPSPTDSSENMNTNQSKSFSVRQLALLAMFAAVSFGIYTLETLIPNPLPIPGIKLGLSNIVILIVLKRYNSRSAAMVLAVRLLLSALLFGSLVSLLYSAVGGTLCLLIEVLTDRFMHGKALFITASAGALFHNVGQLAVALLITHTTGVILYAPYLAIAGIITGLLTGLCALFVLKKLPAIEKAERR